MLVCLLDDPLQAFVGTVPPPHGGFPENAVPGAGIKNKCTAKSLQFNAMSSLLLKLADYAPLCKFTHPEMQVDKYTGSQQAKDYRPDNIVA